MTRTEPVLVDTHAHLGSAEFEGQVGSVLERARSAGVKHVITVGTSYEETLQALEIARTYEDVHAAGGIHPNYVAQKFGGFGDLKRLFESEPLVAVGETGLDFYRDYTPPAEQTNAFRAHLELALERDLPVIIHIRDAYAEALEIIDSLRIPPRGVFHCYSGSADIAREVLARGFFISIAGQVTFKKADELRGVVASLPLENLLVETDSPYLAPVPRRSKTNEPAFVRYTARRIAEVTGVSFKDVARATTVNAWRLFGVGDAPTPGEIAYEIGENLYLNITNRCTNACPWCVRFASDYLRGHDLKLEHEPSFEEITGAVGDPATYDEVVFCGYGEPTERIETVKEVAAWLKARNARVRLDTNGLGTLSAGRDIAEELADSVDSVSVSLNTADAAQYVEICRPHFGEASHAAVVDFIRRAKATIGDVTATAVALPGVDLDAARQLAEGLGAAFKVRRYRPHGRVLP